MKPSFLEGKKKEKKYFWRDLPSYKVNFNLNTVIHLFVMILSSTITFYTMPLSHSFTRISLRIFLTRIAKVKWVFQIILHFIISTWKEENESMFFSYSCFLCIVEFVTSLHSFSLYTTFYFPVWMYNHEFWRGIHILIVGRLVSLFSFKNLGQIENYHLITY